MGVVGSVYLEPNVLQFEDIKSLDVIEPGPVEVPASSLQAIVRPPFLFAEKTLKNKIFLEAQMVNSTVGVGSFGKHGRDGGAVGGRNEKHREKREEDNIVGLANNHIWRF